MDRFNSISQGVYEPVPGRARRVAPVVALMVVLGAMVALRAAAPGEPVEPLVGLLVLAGLIIPPLVMFLFFNKRIVAGMTAGAVKG